MYHKLKYDLEERILPLGLNVYSVAFVKEFGKDVFQVLLTKKGNITLSDLEKANEIISDYLDKIPDFPLTDYLLEVSSAGAERILALDEVKDNIGKYIHIESGDNIYEGYLKEVLDNSYLVEINLKGRIKTIEILIKDINLIRLAVKL